MWEWGGMLAWIIRVLVPVLSLYTFSTLISLATHNLTKWPDWSCNRRDGTTKAERTTWPQDESLFLKLLENVTTQCHYDNWERSTSCSLANASSAYSKNERLHNVQKCLQRLDLKVLIAQISSSGYGSDVSLWARSLASSIAAKPVSSHDGSLAQIITAMKLTQKQRKAWWGLLHH